MNNFFFCNLFLVLSYNIMVIVMNIKNKLNRYLNELEYKIVFINNSVNINNYIEIMDFTDEEVTVKHKDGITRIKGKNLVVSKMLDEEILITGFIKEIIVK